MSYWYIAAHTRPEDVTIRFVRVLAVDADDAMDKAEDYFHGTLGLPLGNVAVQKDIEVVEL